MDIDLKKQEWTMLQAISAHMATHPTPPSIRDLLLPSRLKSVSTVISWLLPLEDKGLIKRLHHRSRSIVITPKGQSVLESRGSAIYSAPYFDRNHTGQIVRTTNALLVTPSIAQKTEGIFAIRLLHDEAPPEALMQAGDTLIVDQHARSKFDAYIMPDRHLKVVERNKPCDGAKRLGSVVSVIRTLLPQYPLSLIPRPDTDE